MARNVCTEPDCEDPPRSRGLCGRHYARARRAGALPQKWSRRYHSVAEVDCRIDGCESKAKYRGQRLCMKHYLRIWVHGSAELPPRPTITDGLMARSKADPLTGCRVWIGAVSTSGYGRLGTDYAHRVSYETFVGPIPEGLTIDHLCRNKLCVNPVHMEPVTLAENIARANRARAKERA